MMVTIHDFVANTLAGDVDPDQHEPCESCTVAVHPGSLHSERVFWENVYTSEGEQHWVVHSPYRCRWRRNHADL